jgi:hypothetical protein
MVTGKLVEFEGGFVVVLSKEKVAQLGVRSGDALTIDKLVDAFESDSSDQDPSSRQREASEALKIARRVIAENREALRELAK